MQLRTEASAFEPELRQALESWIVQQARTETQAYVGMFAGGSMRGAPTIDFVRLEGIGEVYRLRRSFGTQGSETDPRGTVETYVSRSGFRRVKQESFRFLPDGRVQHESARWTDYRVVPVSEFDAEVENVRALAAAASTIVRHSAEEIARREHARLAKRASTTTQQEKANVR